MSRPLTDLLAPFGALPEHIIDLHGELSGADRLDYGDLQRLSAGARPDAVVRLGAISVAYVLRGERDMPAERVLKLRRLLAQRDDAPFLVVVTPGRLEVYGVGLDRQTLSDAMVKAIVEHEALAPATFRWLSDAPPSTGKAVYDQIYSLLTNAITVLEAEHMSRPDAIALAGRALFIRFLLDRGVIGGNRKRPPDIAPSAKRWNDLFADPARIQETCAWITKTFNGDLAPLSYAAFGSLQPGGAGCRLLTEVIDRRGVQDDFRFDLPQAELREDFAWGELDFAHIPVGLLSQAYENQIAKWMPGRKKDDSVFYTPRRIAQYLVREAFARLEVQRQSPPFDVRILDPAVGGGVFLISAFRELVAAYARAKGRWPTSAALRRILTEQLFGYDIQAEAISFTSLGLYLAAMELDASDLTGGFKFKQLKFKQPLVGTTLFHVADAPLGETAGSLGPAAPAEHFGQFDLVIANPPWTSIAKGGGATVRAVALEHTRETAAERLGEARLKTFDYPDKVPDLPFVWRAMQWAKPGGVLAFVLHGRLLFKSSRKGVQARQDLLEAITVWGLLNGADLQGTNVWPTINAPFCLLMADNTPPPADQELYVLSPYREPGLNASGQLRIDPTAIEPISLPRLAHQPWLMKALYCGTRLDVRLLERLTERGWPTFKAWMKGQGLALKQGFQLHVDGDRNDPGTLRALPLLTATGGRLPLEIDVTTLPPFPHATLHRPRERWIYDGPLFLMRKAMPRHGHRAHVCAESVAFKESFYGLSLARHPAGDALARYLVLLVHSPLYPWFTLMTASTFGMERRTLTKIDVESFPVVPFEGLSAGQRAQADALFERLAANTLPEAELLDWTCQLYGLGRRASEVISETLTVQMPFATERLFASGAPTRAMLDGWAARVAQRLKPFATLRAQVTPYSDKDAYRVVALSRDGAADPRQDHNARQVLRIAEARGASEVIFQAGDRVYLGRLAQRRYWTLSRARLTAARLVGEGVLGQIGGAQ